jgi:membrane protein DedA with SNARE-associated domain
MKTFVVALIQSALTAAYWWLVTTVSYGFFGGSRNPSLPPPDESTVMAQTIGTIVLAVVVYALILIGWKRIAGRSGR